MGTYKEDYAVWIQTGHWPGQPTKEEYELWAATHCKYCGGPFANSSDQYCSNQCKQRDK